MWEKMKIIYTLILLLGTALFKTVAPMEDIQRVHTPHTKSFVYLISAENDTIVLRSPAPLSRSFTKKGFF